MIVDRLGIFHLQERKGQWETGCVDGQLGGGTWAICLSWASGHILIEHTEYGPHTSFTRFLFEERGRGLWLSCLEQLCKYEI